MHYAAHVLLRVCTEAVTGAPVGNGRTPNTDRERERERE